MTQDNPKAGINYIYDYVNRIERSLEKLKEINTFNSKKIIEFHKELVINSMSEATQTKYLDRLILFLKWVNKDFDKLTKQDLIDLIETNLTKNNNYSKSTKSSYRIIIRRFFQWFKGCPQGEYPIEVSWMRGGMDKSKNQKNPEDMLSDEDIEKIVNATQHPRDKALIATLAESGGRISEVLTLRIKHISFDSVGAIFILNGKTGERICRVINAVPYLQAWLRHHPEKDNPDAPLWVVLGCSKYISKQDNGDKYKVKFRNNLCYAATRAMLKKVAQRAGVTKRVNPHSYRHFRATTLAVAGINSAVLNEIFGWSQNSNMSSVYLHISRQQTESVLLNKVYGIKVDESKKDSSDIKNLPLVCINCGTKNYPDANYCSLCNQRIGLMSKETIEKERTNNQILNAVSGLVGESGDLKKALIEGLKKEILEEIKAGKIN